MPIVTLVGPLDVECPFGKGCTGSTSLGGSVAKGFTENSLRSPEHGLAEPFQGEDMSSTVLNTIENSIK